MLLENLPEPIPHPGKPMFKEAKITIWTLASLAGCSESSMRGYLDGRLKPTEKAEAVFDQLMTELKARRSGNGGK